jgi:hypothetical protein
MNDRILRVGTTTADTTYHACRREAPRSAFGVARCGVRCRLTPRPWDLERQGRQDSCHRCVARVRALIEARARREARDPLCHGYLRASTDRQVASPEVQEATMRSYCARNGLGEPRRYVDPDTSGGLPLAEREAGARLLADLRPLAGELGDDPGQDLRHDPPGGRPRERPDDDVHLAHGPPPIPGNGGPYQNVAPVAGTGPGRDAG